MLKKTCTAFFLLAISFVFLGSFQKPKLISVMDFGAIPNDEQNDAAALRSAFDINVFTKIFREDQEPKVGCKNFFHSHGGSYAGVE